MRILNGDSAGITEAAQALASGELVAIPTETVYGLAAVFDQVDAVARVFAAKERPTFDPLIVHIPPSWNTLAQLEQQGLVNSVALTPAQQHTTEACMKAFWPGPLTLILPRGSRVPDLVTSGGATVGIRMPAHVIAQKLLEQLGRGLAAPSANRFGRISPTQSIHVVAELEGRVKFVLEGGPSQVGVESTVVRPEADGSLTLLRPGGVSREQLAAFPLASPASSRTQAKAQQFAAPGMLESHYAPRKPLRVVHRWDDAVRSLPPGVRVGLLLQSQRSHAPQGLSVTLTQVLSPSGDLNEAARNLFRFMRLLDDSPEVDWILAEPCSDTRGLGHAINDRLQRAGVAHTGVGP